MSQVAESYQLSIKTVPLQLNKLLMKCQVVMTFNRHGLINRIPGNKLLKAVELKLYSVSPNTCIRVGESDTAVWCVNSIGIIGSWVSGLGQCQRCWFCWGGGMSNINKASVFHANKMRQ